MPTLSFKFQCGKFPEGFRGNIQGFADKLAELLTGFVDGAFLGGQVGGSTPTTDVGIWVHGDQIELWNEEAATYRPFSSVPVGSVIAYAGALIPENYLLCDGQEVQRSEYPELFTTLGTVYGSSGDTTFKVPDYRGRYVVGAGQGKAFIDDTAAQTASNIGDLRLRTNGYYYGQEFIRYELRGSNPVTSIKQQRVSGLTAPSSTFSSVTPPSLAAQMIIRAK